MIGKVEKEEEENEETREYKFNIGQVGCTLFQDQHLGRFDILIPK